MFGIGPVELLLPLVYLIPLGLLVWALVDALRTPRLGDIERLTWVIVIILVPCIGPILYFLIGASARSPDPREYMADEAPRPRDDF